jgi:hypothetical protein
MRGTRHNGDATPLTIENGTPGEIEMFWVDGEGRRHPAGRRGNTVRPLTCPHHGTGETSATLPGKRLTRREIARAYPQPQSGHRARRQRRFHHAFHRRIG